MTKTIEEIYDQRPSVLRSNFLIWIVKIFAFLLFILFISLGISLLVMQEKLAENWILFGFMFFLGGLATLMLNYFSNLVLARNRFIRNLEGWFIEQEDALDNDED